MQRLLSALMAAAFMLAFAPVALAAAMPGVTLVYVAHMAYIEEKQGFSPYASLASLMRDLKSRGKPAILFHGGNVLGPSALSSYDKGAHIIGLLNLLQPDVLALGRRDFMYKEDELALRSSEAIFPVVCSNVYDPLSLEPPGDSRRSFIIRRPAHMAFLALVSPEMQTNFMPRRLVTAGGQELLRSLSDEARSNGARFVVATADYLLDDLEEVMEESGVDLLFISDAPLTSFSVTGGRGLALYGAGNDEALLVHLSGDGRGGLAISGHETVNLRNYAPEPEMQAAVRRYSELFSGLTRVEVGTVLTALDTRANIVRNGENAMGNLIADAMRDYYGADVALINSGNIRGNSVYPAGTLLRRGDLQKELPMHDMSCLVNVRGETILAALEHGLAQVEHSRGRFLQLSGLQVVYDQDGPPGARVRSVTVGGAPLEPGGMYSVSLPESINSHSYGFYMFPGECRAGKNRPQQELVEIVRVYLSLHSPMSPRVEGRIQPLEKRGEHAR